MHNLEIDTQEATLKTNILEQNLNFLYFIRIVVNVP